VDTLGFHTGAIHTGHAICELAPGGYLEPHLHPYEQSFYVLSGTGVVDLDGRAWRVGPDDFGLAPLGVRHAWRNPGRTPVRWLEVSAPQPRPQSRLPQTLWLGGAPPMEGALWQGGNPSLRWLGHFREASLPPHAEGTVDGYSGGNIRGASIKMLVDHLFGAQHHNLFVVEFAPGGIGTLHDHDFEETYFYLKGEMTGLLDGEEVHLRPLDIVWNGVGGAHEFRNTGKGPARWLETMAPQPPDMNAFRFYAEWERLAEGLASRGGEPEQAAGR
jgi:mannose-6-phosphate isomerase-like protein (cupin superfamily)